jgi:DUF1016 N-terminal domain
MLSPTTLPAYKTIHVGIADVLATARTQATLHVNALMTASYWDIGRRIVEAEQKGKRRAGYGEQLLMQLSVDLTAQFGRGLSVDNLQLMRNFYLVYAVLPIPQTVSGELGFASEVIENQIYETVSRKSKKTSTSNDLSASAQIFKLEFQTRLQAHFARLKNHLTAHCQRIPAAMVSKRGWASARHFRISTHPFLSTMVG